MTLHEAIIYVLEENGNKPLSFDEIALRINKAKLYFRKKDKEPLEGFQVRLRTKISVRYKHLFLVNNDMVSLNLS